MTTTGATSINNPLLTTQSTTSKPINNNTLNNLNHINKSSRDQTTTANSTPLYSNTNYNINITQNHKIKNSLSSCSLTIFQDEQHTIVNSNDTNYHCLDSSVCSVDCGIGGRMNIKKGLPTNSVSIDSVTVVANTTAVSSTTNGKKIKRNSSLISFKSLDMSSIKSFYTSLRNKGGNTEKIGNNELKINDSHDDTVNSSITSIKHSAPYLKIEPADSEETETLLIQYSQSPGGSRGSYERGSTVVNEAQFLDTPQFKHRDLSSQSHSSSPFLSISQGNIRRSSTSDIIGKRHPSSASESRRPSTSDLLRRARERKNSDGRLGRSISHGGLPRGGLRTGRRTSMAF